MLVSYRDALITVDAELLLVRADDEECLDTEGSGNSERKLLIWIQNYVISPKASNSL